MSDIDTVSPQTTEPADTGLDAIIDGAIDKLSGGQVTDTPAPAEGKTPETDTEGKTREYHRGEGGKFAKKPDEAAPASDVKPDAAVATAEPTPTPEPALQPLEPPARWSDADKAEFAKLPPEAQKVLLAREKAMEGDYTRKTQELAETRKAIEPVIGVISEWSPYLRQLGMPPATAIQQLLAAEYTLRMGTPEQKLAAFQHLARSYNIKFPGNAEPAPQQGGEELPNWQDPQVQELGQQVSTLSQALQQMQRDAQLAERQRAEAEFAGIGATRNTDGSPKYPHWDRVRDTMIQLVASGRRDTWDAAYDTAVRMDDELYSEIVNKRITEAATATQQAEEKRRQEAVEKASKAAPVVQSNTPPAGETKKRGLDAALDSAMAKVGLS